MKEPTELIFKHFWLVFIIGTLINVTIVSMAARKNRKSRPELAESHRKYIRVFAIYYNIPWIVMGIGVMIGGAPTSFHFFRPRDGNPYVLAFHGAFITVWLLSAIWIYLMNGAKVIAERSELLQKPLTPLQVKLRLTPFKVAAVVAMIMSWILEVPVPEFPT